MKLIYLFALFIFFTIAFSQQTTTGTISIKLKNIKNNNGQIRACLFNTKDGFPDKPIKAFKFFKTNIVNKENMILDFSSIPFGEYAIAILHDEDNDDKMKTGKFGMPKEGYGISNNVKGIFGPPKFESAKINLNSTNIFITISMTY